jgi:hypothetical protein
MSSEVEIAVVADYLMAKRTMPHLISINRDLLHRIFL